MHATSDFQLVAIVRQGRSDQFFADVAPWLHKWQGKSCATIQLQQESPGPTLTLRAYNVFHRREEGRD